MESVALVTNPHLSKIQHGISKTRVAAEKMGQMVATSFVNTMLETLKMGPKIDPYKSFLAEGIVESMDKFDDDRGFKSYFTNAIENQFTGRRNWDAYVANADVAKNDWVNLALPPKKSVEDGANVYEKMEAVNYA